MNVLIYVLDSLRADHLSCYGYERETSPNIDSISEDGIRYEQCYSTSTWTKPVAGTLLTGAYPPTHGARKRDDILPKTIDRLPAILSREGYATGGFSTMGNVSSATGFTKGFDDFFDLYKDPKIIAKRRDVSAAGEELEQEDSERVALPIAEDINDSLFSWIDEQEDNFFALCWSIDTHAPFLPPEDYQLFVNQDYAGPIDGTRETFPKLNSEDDIEHLINLYDSEITYNDSEIGQLIDHLKTIGEYDDTMIIIAGDHGEAFFEHDHFTHGHHPHDEVARVPLILKPVDGEEKQVKEGVVSLVDLVPTILEACDVKVNSQSIQGEPLAPIGTADTTAPVFTETAMRDIPPSYYSVRTDEWKYIKIDRPDRNIKSILKTINYGYRSVKQIYGQGFLDIARNPGYFLDRYQTTESDYLYEMVDDPQEMNNRARLEKGRKDELNSLIEQWRNNCKEVAKTLNSDISKKEIDSTTDEQLRQLGYLE